MPRRRKAAEPEKSATAQTVTIRRVPIGSLKEDPRNARRHPDRNRAVVRASLEEFGQVEPLVVQAGTGLVIGGNCRLAELRALGVEDVLVAEVQVSGAKLVKLALALNRSSEMGAWDSDALAKLLEEVGREDAESIGFDLDMDDLFSELVEDEGWSGLGGSGGKENAIKDPIVTVLIHCKDAATVEAALEQALASGAANRGDALLTICRSYVDAQGQR
jgi:hypothetical protein